MNLLILPSKKLFNLFHYFTTLGIFLNIALLSSCSIEKWFPGKVAHGTARLTVANLGLMVAGIKQEGHFDNKCDFIANKASTSFLKEGLTGEIGQIIWDFNECNFDFKDGTTIFDTNNKPLGILSGMVTVSGKKIISGYLTGNNDFPIIPEGSTSFSIHFSVVNFSNFKAELAGIYEHLTLVDGELAFDVFIHLAKSESLGLCSHPVHNLTFKNIIFNPRLNDEGVKAHLPGFWGDFEVTIKSSNFYAQQNTFENDSNTLAGTISVWDSEEIDLSSDKLGLNPDFKTEVFTEELQNINDLELPLNYDCPVEKFLVTQASRLLVQNFGNITQIFGSDRTCGPISAWYPEWISANTWLIFSPLCKYQYEMPLNIFNDCNQTKTYVKGKATVSATTTVRGTRPPPWLTIYRVSPDNISFNFKDIDLKDFTSYDLASDETSPRYQLIIKKGTLSGKVDPIFAEDQNIACNFTVATPIVTFDNVHLKNAQTILQLNLKNITGPEDLIIEFNLDISEAKIFAINGLYKGSGNTISGIMHINNKEYELKDLPLNPFYEQEKFDEVYKCYVDKPIPSHNSEKIAEHCYSK
ncbi:MAG: hypothetical protein O2897_00195 [bacterium]|nr:hypothetical protein [bacterium]